MKKEFVTYQQALDLEKLGFIEPCIGYFKSFDDFHLYGSFKILQTLGNVNAPLKHQVFEWFIQKHSLFHSINHHGGLVYPNVCFYYKITGEIIHYRKLGVDGQFIRSNIYDTYEDAENACIDKLIEILKSK